MLRSLLMCSIWVNLIFSTLTFNWKFAESSSKIPLGINHLLDNPKSGSDSKEFLLKVRFLECWSEFTCWSCLVCWNRLKKSWFPFQISDLSFSKSSQTLVKKGSSQKKPLRVCKKNKIEIIGSATFESRIPVEITTGILDEFRAVCFSNNFYHMNLFENVGFSNKASIRSKLLWSFLRPRIRILQWKIKVPKLNQDQMALRLL